MSIADQKQDLIRRINARLHVMNVDELTQLAVGGEVKTDHRYAARLLAMKPTYGSAVGQRQAELGLPPTGHARDL